MHNRANIDTDKAAKARFQRELERNRSRRRVAFSAIALFALVFTLLTFRLTAGLDPSSSGSSVATTSQPQKSAEPSESADDDTTSSDTQSYNESESDSSSSVDESSPADSTTSADSSSTQAPAAATTRAS